MSGGVVRKGNHVDLKIKIVVLKEMKRMKKMIKKMAILTIH